MGELTHTGGNMEALRLRQVRVSNGQTKLRRWLRNDGTFGFLLIVPTIIVVTLVSLYPSLYAAYISLTNYNPAAGAAKFIGVRNYVDIVGQSSFQDALEHTARFTLLSVVLSMTLGLAMALLLNETFVGRGLLRSAMLVPWALPGVAIGIIWVWFFNGSTGTLNGVLYSLGLIHDYIGWFRNGWLALDLIALVYVWNQAPMATILLLAGLQAIPPTLYRAAKVDGAGPLQRFWHITLPWLRGIMVLVLILLTLNAITMFDLIYVMTQGGPGDSTTVFSWLGYLTIFNFFQFGRGSAVLLILSIISLFLGVVYMRFLLVSRSRVPSADQGEISPALSIDDSAIRRTRQGRFRPALRHRVFGPRATRRFSRGALYLIAIVVGLWSLLPLGWMISTSLMHYSDLLGRPPKLLPIPPTIDNYRGMLQLLIGNFGGPLPGEVHITEKVPSALRNSFIVATGAALVSVVFGSIAGYAYARYGRFKIMGASLVAMLLTKLVPALAVVVPWYIMFRAAHLIDSKLGLIIAYSSFTVPIVLFVMKSYFDGIPVSLERAAWVDGCTRLQALRRVMIPVAIPGVIAGAIFTFILSWNEFFLALNLTSTPKAQTVPVVLGQIATDLVFQPSAEGVLMAVCSTAVVIPVSVAFLFQRYLVQGLIAGSGKG